MGLTACSVYVYVMIAECCNNTEVDPLLPLISGLNYFHQSN